MPEKETRKPDESLLLSENREENLITKIGYILKSIRDGIFSCIDPIFEKAARGMVKTLKTTGLNPRENSIIEQAIMEKYTSALRNSSLLALLASPGVVINDPSSVQYALAVISSVTGIAWFTMSLKEVKEKFINFGVELTGDMLKAFLTTVLIIAITSGYGVANQEIAVVLKWAGEAGIDVQSIFNSRVFRTGSTVMTLFAGVKIFQWLIKAVFKFDANDSMLTGSSDLAKKFYERSLSSLRAAAAILKNEHKLQTANYQITVALNHYYEFLIKTNANLPEKLNENVISDLTKDTSKLQKEFDMMVFPILKDMLKQYEKFIGDDEALMHKYKFTMESIEQLEKIYESGQPDQSLSDNTIATSLENISEFLEIFQDELGGPKTEKFTPAPTV